MFNSGAHIKPGELVKVSYRTVTGNRETIGMILEYDNNDPVNLITAKVIVKGKIIHVGKAYIEKLKSNTHAS